MTYIIVLSGNSVPVMQEQCFPIKAGTMFPNQSCIDTGECE